MIRLLTVNFLRVQDVRPLGSLPNSIVGVADPPKGSTVGP